MGDRIRIVQVPPSVCTPILRVLAVPYTRNHAHAEKGDLLPAQAILGVGPVAALLLLDEGDLQKRYGGQMETLTISSLNAGLLLTGGMCASGFPSEGECEEASL